MAMNWSGYISPGLLDGYFVEFFCEIRNEHSIDALLPYCLVAQSGINERTVIAGPTFKESSLFILLSCHCFYLLQPPHLVAPLFLLHFFTSLSTSLNHCLFIQSTDLLTHRFMGRN